MKGKFLPASDQLYRKINDLLKEFGFRRITTGKIYLAHVFNKSRLRRIISENFARIIIDYLEREVSRKNSSPVVIESKKTDCNFTVSDFVDYVFCPYKVLSRFRGVVMPRTKNAGKGEVLHRREEFLDHLEIVKKSRKTTWRKIIFSLNGRFSRQYRKFLASNLLDSDIIYSSEKAQRLLSCNNIRGKPDYIFRTPRGNILLEIKYSYQSPDIVYNTYKIQMHCYCLLAHKNNIDLTKAFILRFPQESFKLGYPQIYPWNINILQAKTEIGKINQKLGELVKNKSLSGERVLEFNKCVRCNYRYFCNFLLENKL